jgi:hypothetical protein
VELDLLEEVFRGTETTDNQDVLKMKLVQHKARPDKQENPYLKQSVLCLDGNDLVTNQLENTVHHGLETLQNLLIGKGHVAFLNARIREVRLNTNIDRPFLTVVSEVRLDTVLEIHNTLGVNLARSTGSIRKLHFANLGPQDVAEVAVKSGRTT